MFDILLAAHLPAATPAPLTPDMQVHLLEWLILGLIVLGLIIFDLVGHVRKAHEPTMKEATGWLVFYVALAIVFGIYVLFKHSSEFAIEYFSIYFTEYSLSVDNIFIFIIVLASFRVPRKYQQKALLYGIVIALIMRLVFIILGAALLARFAWIFFFFALFLLYTAYAQVKEGLEDDEGKGDPDEYEPNAITRWTARVFKVTQGFVGDKLIVRRSSGWAVTPLLLCIVSIGSVDLMFALDSIPASFGLTHQPFIIFAANAFALMGLRQMFFLVDGLLERLVYLNFGLAAILGFIGLKLLLEAFHSVGMLEFIPIPPALISLGIVVTILAVTVVTSLLKTRRDTRNGDVQ